jgi:hypothetical protein
MTGAGLDAQILKDAYTKMNTFKEKLEARKEVEKQQQAVDEFKLQHEREKKEALAAFEAYKSKVKTREEQIKSECEDKVNKAAATLEQVKSEFKKRVDEFNAAVKKMEAAGGSQVEDLKKRHQKEMADHVTARHVLEKNCCACFSIYILTDTSCTQVCIYTVGPLVCDICSTFVVALTFETLWYSGSNSKYNQMLKERMDEEDKLHDEVERLKKELAAASAKATILKLSLSRDCISSMY